MKSWWVALLVFVVVLAPVRGRAEPVTVPITPALEGSIDSISAIEGGVRLTVPVQLKNTGKDFIALALVPPFPTASSSDGTTYFLQDAGGITRCRNNNPIMGPACMGKPFTQGITISPAAFTVLEPGATTRLDVLMTRERGEGGGTYAKFSALFAIRTFSSLDEDNARTDAENYKRTRTVSAGFPEVRIVRQNPR